MTWRLSVAVPTIWPGSKRGEETALSRSTVASSLRAKPYGKRSSKNASNAENEFVLVHGEVNFRKKIHAKQYVKIFRLERKQGNFNFLASQIEPWAYCSPRCLQLISNRDIDPDPVFFSLDWVPADGDDIGKTDAGQFPFIDHFLRYHGALRSRIQYCRIRFGFGPRRWRAPDRNGGKQADFPVFHPTSKRRHSGFCRF